MLNLLMCGRRRARRAPDPLGPSPLGFRVAPDVKASVQCDGLVLLHLRRGTVFSANRVGATIWNGAVERWSLDRVVESVSRDFHISTQTAQQDTMDFLSQLAAEGLLVTDAR